MRFKVLLLAVVGLFTAVSARFCPAQAPADPPAPYLSDPKYKAAMDEGAQLSKRHQFLFAADSYKKACKIAEGHSAGCLESLYHAQFSDGDLKAAAATAASLGTLAHDPIAESVAAYLQANALYVAAGSKPKPDKLQAVHTLLQQAVTAYPRNAAALFLDGRVLAGLGQTEAARSKFASCAQCLPADAAGHLRAEHFAANPALALEKMAPAFKVTALDGSTFNLDAMGGKVVLIDFWATWCGPCNRELPHMKQIAREFAGQPLVIISVSWDQDEARWKDFVQKNEMTWVQYRDADHKLSDMFGINAIPHYFTIDSDGVLTAEMLGEGTNVEGKLKKLIAQANAAHTQVAVATNPGN